MTENFPSKKFRGFSFKEQKLEGADFSNADIRGADFTGATLTKANFSNATAGLLKRWAIFLVCVSWFLSVVSGFLLASTGVLIANIFDNSSSLENQVGGWAALIVIILVFIAILFRGFNSAIGASFAASFAIIITITFTIVGIRPEAFAAVGIGTGAGAFYIAIAQSITIAFAFTIVIAGAGAFYIAIAISFVMVFVVGIAGTGAMPIIISEVGVLLSAFIAWRTMNGDEKYSLIYNIAVAFAGIGGTSFHKANLTDANFTHATLKNTDFRKANLTRTCFKKTKKLDLVRPGTSYLQKAQVVSILATLQGQDKNFDRQDLYGVNFKGASLTDASFIGADLRNANLQDADLSRAKLVQTQLDGTDFTGATLTGAYIQGWNITTDTKFDGVRCEYVHMRLPTKDNPDPHRKPDNRQEVFADGEFGDFIKPIFDTLDLYHNQGVDPRAIAISFKQLAENHPEADLRIVGMEVRGEDKFLLRAKTAITYGGRNAIAADKSELSAEYFNTYNQLKNLPDREIKLLLAEKENQIHRLENMVMTALERPSFYSNVEQVGFMTNNPGGFSVGGSVDGDINNVQGDNKQQRVSNKTSNFNLQNAQFAGGLVNADTVNANQIGGNITNYNPEQKQNLAQAAADIQRLLNQLSQTYPTTTTSEKMTVVAKAVDEIESNPTLKARVIGALKAGGTEAFKELIDHPLVNVLLASIDGWQDAE